MNEYAADLDALCKLMTVFDIAHSWFCSVGGGATAVIWVLAHATAYKDAQNSRDLEAPFPVTVSQKWARLNGQITLLKLRVRTLSALAKKFT